MTEWIWERNVAVTLKNCLMVEEEKEGGDNVGILHSPKQNE